MIVTSADVIPGQNVQVLGLVRGNIVTSRHIGRDMMAGMKELVGGEIKSYTEMTDQARTVAESRMIAEAERLGADAVVAMRFSSGSLNPGTIEMLAYGTAREVRVAAVRSAISGSGSQRPANPASSRLPAQPAGSAASGRNIAMSTPEFITNLRAKIGNDPLWLTGITAYVEDAQGRILLASAPTPGSGRSSTASWNPPKNRPIPACGKPSRKQASTSSPYAWSA